MKKKIIEHISVIIFVTLLLFGILSLFNLSRMREQEQQSSSIRQFIEVPISNINDPFQRSLLKDVMNVFYPDQSDKNNQIIDELLRTKENEFNKKTSKIASGRASFDQQTAEYTLDAGKISFYIYHCDASDLVWSADNSRLALYFKKTGIRKKASTSFQKREIKFGKKGRLGS